ncbi:MAG TPA: hypothetical protein VFV41_13240, partial [Streptosporangiaceae bacterium]|nr:hypothetical protein [Streptosporangiaceae bacterium]
LPLEPPEPPEPPDGLELPHAATTSAALAAMAADAAVFVTERKKTTSLDGRDNSNHGPLGLRVTGRRRSRTSSGKP